MFTIVYSHMYDAQSIIWRKTCEKKAREFPGVCNAGSWLNNEQGNLLHSGGKLLPKVETNFSPDIEEEGIAPQIYSIYTARKYIQ